MSRIRKSYPPTEVISSEFGKNYEYIILWMLNENDYCEWADFTIEIKPDQAMIKESTLSGYLTRLMDKDYVLKPKRNHYEITPKGKKRLMELKSLKESGKSIFNPRKTF